MSSKKLSYEDACSRFVKLIGVLPAKECIGYESASKIHSVLFTKKWEHLYATKRLMSLRSAGAILLGQILNNESQAKTMIKEFNEDVRLRQLFSSSVREDRKQNLSVLMANDLDASLKKSAFLRFEKNVSEYFPHVYPSILSHYSNDITKRLSMEKIIGEIQRGDVSASLLRKSVLSIMQ